ncbi:MAG: hypothetical protein U5K99_04545 [Anaerolineales bacterium]|nr:hypothetical protein [Anaerolineales bacterium]
MRPDRFLQGIVLFIFILVIAALGSYFVFQGGQKYLPETKPENVARNYILALQKKDFDRAYGYLLQNEETPSFASFQESLLRQRSSISDSALQIIDIIHQEGQAVLELVIIHGGGEPFGSTWREEATGLLIRENGEWKISRFPPPFWGWDWETLPRPLK